MRVAEEIGRVKRDNNVTILQGGRWQSIVDRIVTQAPKLGVSTEFLKTVLEAIHLESINCQNIVMNQTARRKRVQRTERRRYARGEAKRGAGEKGRYREKVDKDDSGGVPNVCQGKEVMLDLGECGE